MATVAAMTMDFIAVAGAIIFFSMDWSCRSDLATRAIAFSKAWRFTPWTGQSLRQDQSMEKKMIAPATAMKSIVIAATVAIAAWTTPVIARNVTRPTRAPRSADFRAPSPPTAARSSGSAARPARRTSISKVKRVKYSPSSTRPSGGRRGGFEGHGHDDGFSSTTCAWGDSLAAIRKSYSRNAFPEARSSPSAALPGPDC